MSDDLCLFLTLTNFFMCMTLFIHVCRKELREKKCEEREALLSKEREARFNDNKAEVMKIVIN